MNRSAASFFFLLVVPASWMLTACGTSAPPAGGEPTTQKSRRNTVAPLVVRIATNPPAADAVILCDNQEPLRFTTPGSVRIAIAAEAKPCSLEISKGGFEPQTLTLDRGTLIRRGVANVREREPALSDGSGYYDPVRDEQAVLRNRGTAAGADVLLTLELVPTNSTK
jgi:hypothetical protein